MILVEAVLGNVADAEWKARLAGGHLDSLALDHWEAQKNRLRKRTRDGTEIAVSLDRGTFLHDGDILLWTEATRTAVVARITLREVMVIHIEFSCGHASSLAMRLAINIGRRWSKTRASSFR